MQQINPSLFTIRSNTTHARLELLLAGSRARIVRFCTHMISNPDAAEDLAQETLLEAWKNRQKLDPQENGENQVRWLLAIARNVCMRWGRSHGHDLAHLAPRKDYADDAEETTEDIPVSGYDIEIELERAELAHLLDRALALLPPATRELLIARYIHASPHAEIIKNLGLSEDALVQRLHRGKLALQRVITTHMPEEAAAYGLVVPEEEKLRQKTRIWCPICGTNHLIKYDDPAANTIKFACSACGQISFFYAEASQDLISPRPILSRQLVLIGEYYRQAITTGQTHCPLCGKTVRAVPCNSQKRSLHDLHSCDQDVYGLSIACLNCRQGGVNPLSHLTLDMPEARQFWQKHPRMRWLPSKEIEHQGQSAILGSFQSTTATAQLDVIYQRDTLKVLNVYKHNY